MKKPKAPKLVTVAVTTTITIIFWIFFTLYQVLTTKAPPSIDPVLLEPLDSSLDTETLGKINNSLFFEEGSFTFFPGNQNIDFQLSPSPTLEPTPVASPTPTEGEEPVSEEPVEE